MLQIDIPGLQCIVEKLGAQLECLCLHNCTRLTGGRILPLIQVLVKWKPYFFALIKCHLS